jgi:hypothetical protein
MPIMGSPVAPPDPGVDPPTSARPNSGQNERSEDSRLREAEISLLLAREMTRTQLRGQWANLEVCLPP